MKHTSPQMKDPQAGLDELIWSSDDDRLSYTMSEQDLADLERK